MYVNLSITLYNLILSSSLLMASNSLLSKSNDGLTSSHGRSGFIESCLNPHLNEDSKRFIARVSSFNLSFSLDSA